MKTKLLHHIIILLYIVLLPCCTSKDAIFPEETAIPDIQTKSLLYNSASDSLFFFVDGDCWIKPQKDPYKFCYFEAAIKQYKQNESLDKAPVLLPTHYALIIYPKSEEELCWIMKKDGVKVSYVPFGFAPVADNKVPDTVMSQQSQRIYNKHTNPVPGMPVMYVVWPIGMSLPDGLECHIEYEAFLPDYSNANELVSFDELRSIERLAIEIANPSMDEARGQSYRTLSALIRNSDNLLGSPVPVGNLKIRVQYGLNIIDNYTQSNGSLSVSGTLNDNASVYIVFENDRWRLSRKGSFFAYSLLLGSLTDIWPYNSYVYSPILNHNYLTVHRAAQYFFHDNDYLTVPQYNYSLRINMNEKVGGGNNYFTFVFGSPLIEYGDFWASDSGHYFFSAIHEMAHFYHYLQKGSNENAYHAAHQLIKESLADFIAWHLSRNYYMLLNGGLFDPYWDYSLGGLRQTWEYTSGSYYSPLFIDLMDDYNQYYHNSNYNDDPITDMPFTSITNIAVQNDSWSAVKSALQGKVGQYFTQTELNTFVVPYDLFISLE